MKITGPFLAAALWGVFVWGIGESVRAEGVDVVTLKDGSVIYGEVKSMENGELKVKTLFGVGDIVTIKWANVVKLTVNRPMPFRLKEGTTLMGTVQEGDSGQLVIKAEPMTTTVTVPIDSVVAINPPILPAVTYQGSFTLGASGTKGNTQLTSGSFLGEFTGKGDTLRLSLIGRYIYADDNGKLITRNSRGTIKLDFFTSKRFYWFTSAFFEQDTFQDLNLRTALAAGPGYQFVEKGDFESTSLKEMQLFGEVGVGYFNEDFKVAQDASSTRLRMSVKFNWPVIPDKVTLYHFSEVFPSIENTKDYYITTDQGIRLNIIEGWVTNFQVTYRYNNSPPPGIKNSDTLYIITLGYNFDTSKPK